MHDIRTLMQTAPVIPVLVVHDADQAIPLAQALVAGGLPVLEVTLRTSAALDTIAAMSTVDGAIVGVGTALDAGDLERAREAGATFAVTPGLSHALGETAQRLKLPLLPGVMTPADIIRARELGYSALKFFPAEQAGGIPMLKAFAGPFVDAVFCPTGGIDASSAAAYRALPNVLCVGGSWVAPKALLESGEWGEVTALAREAVAQAQ